MIKVKGCLSNKNKKNHQRLLKIQTYKDWSFSRIQSRFAKIVVVLFFLIYFILGIRIFGDYGVSFDTPMQRDHSVVNLKYVFDVFGLDTGHSIFENAQNLENYKYRMYGVFPQIFLVLIEYFLDLDPQSSTLWLLRNFYIFIVFFVGSIFFYLILRERFKVWWLSLCGTVIYIVTPHIFAHSFMNIKDSVFLSFLTIALYFSIKFLKYYSWKYLFLTSLFVGIATNIRIIGAILLFVCLCVWSWDSILSKKIDKGKLFKTILLFPITFIFLIIIWPASWNDPIGFLKHVFLNSIDYDIWSGYLLYNGEIYSSKDLPWHYIPYLFILSTPFIYLLTFGVGVILILVKTIKNKWRLYRSFAQKLDLIFLGLFFLPLIAQTILGSNVYHGWRHFLFIHLPFVLIIMVAIEKIWFWYRQSSKISFRLFSSVCISMIIVGVITTSIWMVKNHPFQNFFFNLPSDQIQFKFEGDYWNLAYKHAFEYLANIDSEDKVIVYFKDLRFVEQNYWILTEKQKDKLVLTTNPPLDTSYYMIVNYGSRRTAFPLTARDQLIHKTTVDGLIINIIIKKTPDLDNNIISFVRANDRIRILNSIKSGANLNFQNIRGESAIIEAIKNQNYEILKILLESGADANQLNRITQKTPLMLAVEQDQTNPNYISIIQLLLQFGADPNYTNNKNQSARDSFEVLNKGTNWQDIFG